MDPITILGAVGATLKIVKEVCQTIQWMQRVYDSIKNSDRTLKMILLECNIYGDSIKTIGEWLRDHKATKGLQRQMRTTNHAITLVRGSMGALQKDMQKIGNGELKLSIKSFKNCINVRHQWFEQTMKIHLTELRCHSQTLQLTLQVIQLTTPSELPPSQTKKAPEALERKTKSLEKRLLLRHFITKALEIRRAEVMAEEERRSQAMKEFIRVPAVSSPVQAQTQIQPDDGSQRQPQKELQGQSSDQPPDHRVVSVVEQARQQAVAEKESKLEDLLSDDIEDLIDFSVEPPAPPGQALTDAKPQALHSQEPSKAGSNFHDLDGLRGLFTPQEAVRDVADKVEGNVPTTRHCTDAIAEPKRPQSSQLTSQSPNISPSMPDVDQQHQKSRKLLEEIHPTLSQLTSQSPDISPSMPDVDKQHQKSGQVLEETHPMSSQLTLQPSSSEASAPDLDALRSRSNPVYEPEQSESGQVASQILNPDPGTPDVDLQGAAGGHPSDTSPATTATSSIFSHASTLSSNSNYEEELHKRSSYAAPPSQIVRRKVPRSVSASGSPALGSISSAHMASALSSSPSIHEGAEFNPSSMSRASTGDSSTPAAPGLAPRGKSENEMYHLTSAADPLLERINKPDAEGFPWIVQVARDGDETKLKWLIEQGADLDAVHIVTKRTALCEASEQGHSKIVDILIHEGCPLDNTDAEACTALHHACHKGQLAVAKTLIAAKANIEAPGPEGQTPIHLAVKVPHRNVVMLLLQHNANINARDEYHRTPLHISAAKGNVEMCNYLLDNGAQVDNRDSQSKTALELACAAGHYESTEAMLKRSNLRTTDLTFLAAFFAAVEHGHVRVAESFLGRGLDLQNLNKNDVYKPATLAAKSGNQAMLELMNRANCIIKAKDDNDWNALHFAAQQGHWQLIEPLVTSDVSVKAATRKKDTPLILAVKGGHFTATEILLRSKGVSVTAEDAQAQQPIHHATRAGSFDIFNLLMINGAKVAVGNAFGWHPIHIAIAYGHTALVERLIEQSARVEEKLGSSSVKHHQTHKMVEDGYWAEARWPYPGSRPLHLACEYGHYQIASDLIRRGAKLEASCSEGWRPLHHAAFNGSPALVELLLNAGCYPWAETEEGLTPQGVQFRTAGSPITEDEKTKVRLLLQEAMDRMTKQNDAKQFKAGRKKGRTVEEKQNFIRSAAFSVEMAAKSSKHSTKPYRPYNTPPPIPHSNTFPSAIPTIHHPPQATEPSPPLERPASSSSNRPSITLSESDLKNVPSITSPATSLSNLASNEQSESKPEETTSNTALAQRSATKVAVQHSIGPMQGLPGLPLNLMKNKFKLKRASTFGADMSKQGIEKMSTGLDISRQGIEKVSSFGLDVSKQGLEKMSSFGLDVSKQGLEKMSSYSQNMSKQGMNMSKQGLEKMGINLMKKNKVGRMILNESEGNGLNGGTLSLASDIITTTQGSESNTTSKGKRSRGLRALGGVTEVAGVNQSSTGDITGSKPQRDMPDDDENDDDIQNDNTDDAKSISAFTMGGFDAFDNGGDGDDDGGDGGDF